ncbi:MAG: very short patch repair endonuclease [Terracidiphilus sp.]
MDRVTPEVRSKIMSSVHSRGNRSTEKRLGTQLWSLGLRGYRKHWKVDGTPDFAWPKRKVAIFVDGCFWHGCSRCNRPSKSNLSFWETKIARNRERDERVTRCLRDKGWTVIRIWECQVSSRKSLSRIILALNKRKDQSEF